MRFPTIAETPATLATWAKRRNCAEAVCLLLLAVTMLLWSGCNCAASQTLSVNPPVRPAAATPQAVATLPTKQHKAIAQIADAQGRIIGHAANAKYGLSVSIYTDELQTNFYIYDVAVDNERTSQSELARYFYTRKIFPADSPQVWSPDEEYLLLPCAGEIAGFCFYKTAALVIVNATNERGEECEECFSFQVDNEPIDKIVIARAQGAGEYAHQFDRWASNTAIVFTAQRVAQQGTKNKRPAERPGKYKYDIASGTLSCLTGPCAAGENKQGKVRLSDVRQQK